MDVITRALLDLGTLDVDRSEDELPYLEFKNRVRTLLTQTFGGETQVDRFLEEYFLSFLPAILHAAAEQEGLASLKCDDERALVEEVLTEKRGILAHSPILYPLNRKCFQTVKHQRPALDLGIGNGRSSQYCLVGRELDVGADIIVSNLLKARARRSHTEYYALDMASLPFDAECFRTLYALNCIYHVQGGRQAGLAEMVRVLAPGGTLALTDISAHLNSLKPLQVFLSSLGFDALAGDFTRYFLSGYGADGSPGDPAWYHTFLERLGMVDIEVSHIMSPRLTALGYLLYDWQALFNFDASRRLESQAGEHRYASAYRPMLGSLIAPLLKLDAQHCKNEGKGGYLFVTARKPGTTRALPERRLTCPECKTRLQPELACPSCKRKYPITKGIPLLASFFADSLSVKAQRSREQPNKPT
jgi:SAM-dependent methyltransferase